MRNNPKGPCLYLQIGFNVSLDLFVKLEGATSISIILLIDLEVRSSPIYIYIYIKSLGQNTPELPYGEP
jgi:hypothetical protein